MATSALLYYATLTGNSSITLHGGTDTEIAMNDVTGPDWTPLASRGEPIFAGGPPFTFGGVVNSLVLKGYDAVEEQIPIQIRGATKAAILDTLTTLRQALNSTKLRSPAVLSFVANNLSNTTYYLILEGSVQESPAFINREDGRLMMRAVITWTRGSTGLDSGVDVLQNAQTITNNANAAPPNYKIMDGMKGDLIYAGQPLVWSVVPIASGMFAGAGVQRAYVATLHQAPTYISTADAISTTSTTGVTIATENVAISLSRASFNIKQRIISRITSPSANLEVRIQVVFGNGSVGTTATVYTSEWIAPGTSTTIVDFDMFVFPQDMLALSGTVECRIITQARSTNGASATGTWTDIELLHYYTFCRITSTVSLTNAALYAQDAAGYAALPVGAVVPYTEPQIRFLNVNISGIVVDFPEVIGDPPIGIEDAYFWIVTLTGGVHDSTDTGTLSITASRLWQTIRGS